MKVEDRLDALERELAEIKTILSVPKSPRVVKLKGLLRGMSITREEVEGAERSLFKHATDYGVPCQRHPPLSSVSRVQRSFSPKYPLWAFWS